MKEIVIPLRECTSPRFLIRWEYWIPILLCLILMVPRLSSPQFGLFDDGNTVENARTLVSGTWSPGWDASEGRFRPAYWLFPALIYRVFGANPLAFFVFNALIWAATTGCIVYLAKKISGNGVQAGIAGILYALSGPVFENYYTLSKGEGLQVLGIAAALCFCTQISSTLPRGRTILSFIGAFLGMTFAILAKETSLLMVPLTGIWLALALFWRRIVPGFNGWINRGALFLATVLSSLLYFFWRAFYVRGSINSGSYAGDYIFEFQHFKDMAVQWAGWLRRDYMFLAFLILLILLIPLVYKKLSRFTLPYIELLIWLVAWVGVFLPWKFAVEYYLLSFALGAALFSALILGDVWMAMRDDARRWWKVVFAALLLGAGFFWLASLPTFYSNARIQLELDRMNGEMMNYVATNAPSHGTIFVNLPGEIEYAAEVPMQLANIYGRPDLKVTPFAFQTAHPSQPALSAWVLSPYVYNKPLLTVRFGIFEEYSDRYQRALEHFLGGSVKPIYNRESQFHLLYVDAIRLFCPITPKIRFCALASAGLDRSLFQYGWKIYTYQSQVNEVARPGTVSPEGSWSLQRTDGSIATVHFGQPGDQPVTGDWNRDGLTDLGVYSPLTHTWSLDTNWDGKAEISYVWEEMQTGDIPFAGDWTGSGKAGPGFFRPSNTSWHFRTGFSTDAKDLPVLTAGRPTDLPLVGDWNGSGKTGFGVYRPDTGEVNLESELQGNLDGTDFILQPNLKVVAANWTGSDQTTLAYIIGDQWHLIPANCDCWFSNQPAPVGFPINGGIPVAGRWGKP